MNDYFKLKMNVKEELRGTTWEDGYGRGFNSALEQVENILIERGIIPAKLHRNDWHYLTNEEKKQIGEKFILHKCKINNFVKLSDCLEYFINKLEPDIGCAEDYLIIKTPVVPINSTCFFDKFKTGMVEVWKNKTCVIHIFIPFDEWDVSIEEKFDKYIDWMIVNRIKNDTKINRSK